MLAVDKRLQLFLKIANKVNTMSEFIKFEVVDHIGIITIDRPPVNAVCESIRVGLTRIFEELNTRTDVYCCILRAEGRMFSAGHDLKEAGQSKDPEFRKRVNPTIDASLCTSSLPRSYGGSLPRSCDRHGFCIRKPL